MGAGAAHWEQMNTVLPLLPGPGVPAGAPGPDALPDSAREHLATTPFGLYVHVPFCATRCGYCDFNTYTSDELGPGANRAEYAGTAIAELRRAAATLGPELPTVSTVFVGGGTPTLLPADDLAAVLAEVRRLFPVSDDVEVTTEANPETVDRGYLSRLREAGFTRVSLGMQSAAEHVLAVLDRRHTPGRAVEAAHEARAAGFEHVNLDLIYGTPGRPTPTGPPPGRRPLRPGRPRERLRPDRRGGHPAGPPDQERRAAHAGRRRAGRPLRASRHDPARGRLRLVRGVELGDVGRRPLPAQRAVLGQRQLVGRGAGAHSHVGGLRWWNVKHPAAYADRLTAGTSPAQDAELLDDADRALETIMLGLRLREGLALGLLSDTGRARAADCVARGLLDPVAHAAGRAVLTDRGRLLADAVVRDLTD
ncbi:coproporphyrinogen-III oxidase family protein [Blastococcus brunescens]|uniref:Heme chaperone HemW n=1 Tax=Blastococcus brunescens TaxID=1564165 RepID=A0ABZ1B425_9ACTN|nr:coproporphyrinogen-III oxidase family protein [Blastococcus sp. BMG 8361]WRL65550.1 coproporphyrinogen-III oxidase family protein [Blastococcus sp. BMG 8361]